MEKDLLNIDIIGLVGACSYANNRFKIKLQCQFSRNK